MTTAREQALFYLVLGGLIGLAWWALLVWGQSPYGRYLDHGALSVTDLSSGIVVLAVLGGWTLMIMAMMLPASLPLVAMFERLVHQRVARTRLVALLIAGYLNVAAVATSPCRQLA